MVVSDAVRTLQQRVARSARTAVWVLVAVAAVLATFVTVPVASAATTVSWSDQFNRKASSWGKAWRVTAGSAHTFTTTGKTARIAAVAPGKSAAAHAGPRIRDAYAQVVVTMPRVPAGRLGVYTALELRRQTNGLAYRAKLTVTAKGATSLSVTRVVRGVEQQVGKSIALRSLILKPGSRVVLQAKAVGRSPVAVSVRAYKLGAKSPGWALTVKDTSSNRVQAAGQAGVWSYIGRNSVKSTLEFDSFTVRALAAPAPVPAKKAVPTPVKTPAPAPAPATSARVSTQALAPAAPSAGASPVGSARYAIPAGAIFVNPSAGNDAASGSSSAPLKTLARAISVASSGRTVVLRGGTYREDVVIPAGKALTVQNYPGEAVWLDGSSAVSGFVQQGAVWVKSGWGYKFDTSPTFSWGAPDGTQASWQFVNPSAPMAAHPDQVFVGSTELRQVGVRSAVVAGTFFVDRAASQLVLGSNPGSATTASTKVHAITVSGAGSVIRGIGVRKYANSVPHQGAVTVRANNVTVENVVVADNATGGLGAFGSGVVFRNVTVTGNGHLGIQAHKADNLTIDRAVIASNNDQKFNAAPAAGGIKVTATRGFTVRHSVIDRNVGNGVWADVATYNMTIVGNRISGNTHRGLFLEISSLGIVADNLITGSGSVQISIRNTDRIQVWNNTVIGTTTAMEFTQDSRTPLNYKQGTDSRRPYPDPEMTFVTAGNVVGNNVMQAGTQTNRLLSIEDFTKTRAAASMVSRVAGNVYSQPASSTPRWLVVWSRPGTDPAVFTTIPAFVTATGQDRTAFWSAGVAAVDGGFQLTAVVAGKTATVAAPIPAAVSAVLGVPAGAKALGYWA